MILWKQGEVAIRCIIVYLKEKEEDLFKEYMVGKSDTYI